MFDNCVLVPATYYKLKEKYGKDTCEHCMYHQYGCPEKDSITFKGHRYLPLEESEKVLPRVKIWCRECKAKNAEIQHEVFWNCKPAYAIQCPVCGAEFLLYKQKVHVEYTGFVNKKGEYVSPHEYRERIKAWCGEDARKDNQPEAEHVATFWEEENGENTAMKDALKRAGII